MIHNSKETVIIVTSVLYLPYAISNVPLRKHILPRNEDIAFMKGCLTFHLWTQLYFDIFRQRVLFSEEVYGRIHYGKKGMVHVCACGCGRQGGWERERERETRISPSYSGLHVTAHVLPTFGKQWEKVTHWGGENSKHQTWLNKNVWCTCNRMTRTVHQNCDMEEMDYQCECPRSSSIGTFGILRSHICIPDSSSAVTCHD